ncbi:hypothetical protein [Sphingomonas sp. M1-B02]|uniref:hypothetical protein n=1 Tax=Sphingomonas sp. M1-B02 TaxID=3114300 RepID=UPI002240A6DB|nr:hypothetical protein [Sphingomonas sp. S6-11]UZK66592.1 hypothetical protein OKW87_01760 [Sphingomonas sp. S6-11]
MNIKRISLLTVAAASALALAACSGSSEADQEDVEANAANLTLVEPENVANVMVEAPAATRVDNSASTEVAPPVTLSPDEQTQVDADATGMTARVSRDEGGNETAQPAQ